MTEEQPTRLMPEARWQAILQRASLGESTQDDAQDLIEECARLGRQALGWRQLARVWREYAESMRKAMVKLSETVKNEVDG